MRLRTRPLALLAIVAATTSSTVAAQGRDGSFFQAAGPVRAEAHWARLASTGKSPGTVGHLAPADVDANLCLVLKS